MSANSVIKYRRFVAATLSSLTVLLLCAGCALFAPPGTQTAKLAQATVRSQVGVETSRAKTNAPLYSPQGSSTSIFVTVKVGYEVHNSRALLDWLLRMAWSINDKKVKSGVYLIVDRSGAVAPAWDWAGAATEFAFSQPAPYVDEKRAPVLFFSNAEMTKRYGPWPGQVPKTPANLFVKS